MKRVWLSVSAAAALAVGWVGGDGLASSTGPNADSGRTAEIAALSFPDDAKTHDWWKSVQRAREDRLNQNKKIEKEIDAQKKEIPRVERRLEELNKAIKDSRTAIENEKNILAAIEWHREAGQFLTELEAIKGRVDAHDRIHRSKWQETKESLAGFGNLDFDGKIKLRDEALGIKKEYIEELEKMYETYSQEFDDLKTKIANHLESLDPPTP